MRRPWRSRPRRGFPAAPSWPSLSPQRGGCLRKTPACGILFFVWCGFAWGLPGGKSTVLLREYSARQSPGSFSLSVQAVGLRGLRQPLNNPGVRQPPLFLRRLLRPDGPSGCAVPGAAVLAFALSSARRMPQENPRLWDFVLFLVRLCPEGFSLMSLSSRLAHTLPACGYLLFCSENVPPARRRGVSACPCRRSG